eukprot:gnl/TRDRNA2_/TRDRNA2_188725_c0_seq1.p1 gnl/TRDRNA2_/TRDRNA2_188725_c0~~gnl/TRDRNA2_/TRDRNA2_188725_c0_seq1.p1  ORF type:complete len:201 (-),score=33.77 gnl/TRDRNA2_/TRDRNA2_188725_c0_seq1:109-711(-)
MSIRKSVGPMKFHKVIIPKAYRSPVLYGWHHNIPWSKYNNFAYFWSERRPIRKTVVNHAQRVKQTRSFGNLIEEVPSVIQELSQEGPFTMFCPNNDAMDMIRESAWDKLWNEDRCHFIRHHTVLGRWSLADLVAAEGAADQKDGVMSLAEQPLEVTVEGSLETMDRVVRIGGAAVTKGNIRCWNGYCHIIDRPLMPRWRS